MSAKLTIHPTVNKVAREIHNSNLSARWIAEAIERECRVNKLVSERDELQADLIELIGRAQTLAVLAKHLGKLVGVNGKRKRK